MNKTIIAIDPGGNGGIAVWKKNHLEQVLKMPKSLTDLNVYFEHLRTNNDEVTVFIEKVQMFHSDSDEENKGKQFRIKYLLANYEQLKALIVYFGFQYVEVAPITWQSKLGFRSKGIDKETRKNMYKKFAGIWFPTVVPTLWNGDALCILKFSLNVAIENPDWITERLKNKKRQELF